MVRLADCKAISKWVLPRAPVRMRGEDDMGAAMVAYPLEAAFDVDADMDEFFDFDRPAFPNRERVSIGFELPKWIVVAIDAEEAAESNGGIGTSDPALFDRRVHDAA